MVEKLVDGLLGARGGPETGHEDEGVVCGEELGEEGGEQRVTGAEVEGRGMGCAVGVVGEKGGHVDIDEDWDVDGMLG
ncbi:hypothetical protein OCU04_010501 [Sclerotinia nivalis]|uniref:Uncharacterized protein n=1 Tax=Sclerotinia nivalis TaxID=352851 RepID=A0A9X0DFV2_9HELO|nr:hypothetical protein OCU04_010501 [Sclerotinia nivalis]